MDIKKEKRKIKQFFWLKSVSLQRLVKTVCRFLHILGAYHNIRMAWKFDFLLCCEDTHAR